MTLHANIIIFMTYLIFVLFLVWFKKEKIREYKKLPVSVKVAIAPAVIVVCVGAAYALFFHILPFLFNTFSGVFKSFWFWGSVVSSALILFGAEVWRNEKYHGEKSFLVQDLVQWLFNLMSKLLNWIERKEMSPTKKRSKIKDPKIAKVASVVENVFDIDEVPNPHKKQKRPRTQLELSQAQAKLKQKAEDRKNKPTWTLVEDSE